MERNHGRQRPWFGRFKRQSISVAQSKVMVDLTMALLAMFWSHGHQEGLLSVLDGTSPRSISGQTFPIDGDSPSSGG
jgi:hypothetical protein